MANTIQFKRRVSGAAGAPSALKSGEVAHNEVDDTLYVGKGDDGSGNATSVVPLAGKGSFADLTSTQTIGGAKTFSTVPKSSQDASGSTDLVRKSQFDTGLATKAAATHSHAISDVTGLQTALDGKVDAAELNNKIKYGRAFVAGYVTALTWSSTASTATPTVSLSEGKLYEEDQGGQEAATIAPITGVSLGNNEGIIVDFDTSAIDGSGRYIPTKVTIALGAETGWQTGRRYVLIAKQEFSRNLFGEYGLITEIPQDAAALDVAVKNAVAAPLKSPIDPTVYGVARLFHPYALTAPTTDIEFSENGQVVTLAAPTGRLYYRHDTTFYAPWFAPGDKVAIWFRAVSGAPSSAQVLFYNSSNVQIGATINMVKLGPFYYLEMVAPATAYNVRIDIRNAVGAIPLVMTTPAYAKADTEIDVLTAEKVVAFDSFRASFNNDRENAWPSSYTVGKISGDGATTTVQPDGRFLSPANTSSYARYDVSLTTGTKRTWLVHLSRMPGNFVGVRHQGKAASEVFFLDHIGGGWYYGELTVGAGIGPSTTYVRLEVDNRNSLGTEGAGNDVYADKIYFLPGHGMPSTVPATQAVAEGAYDATEIVITQEAGAINVFVPGGKPGGKYLRHRIEQFNVAPRASGWGWETTHEATRTGDTTFTIGDRLLNGGENWLAVREQDKTDFMGGPTHGDDVGASFLFFVDGVAVTIDGSTSYRGKSVEFIRTSQLMEVDNVTYVPTFDVATAFQINHERARLHQRLRALRSLSLAKCYLAMLSFERYLGGDTNAKLLSGTAYWSPTYAPYDVSAEGHGAPQTSADRIKLSGPSGYAVDVKAVEGWTNAARKSFVQDTSQYNKLYFSPVGIYPDNAVNGAGYAVSTNDVIELVTEYRLTTRN